ncbi:MAG: AAA family ATPase [Clostridia bacterium]|nr:AAA family ATPase [Clostridia bacterium]
MERALEFEKFRNIGFDKKEKLVLNNSLEKGRMGNLVIVVGANNSGKSNVLDAIAEFKDKKLSAKDTTMLSYNEADRHPSLTLRVKDGEEVYSYKLTYNDATIRYPESKLDYSAVKKEDEKTLGIILDVFKEHGLNDSYQVLQNLEKLKKTDNISEIEEVDNNLANIIKSLKSNSRSNIYGSYRYAWDSIYNRCQNNRHFSDSRNQSKDEIIEKVFSNKYGISFFPNIYKYSEIQISDKDLKVNVSHMSDSYFFKAVFSAIDFKFKDIDNAYAMFNKHGNKGILKDLEDKINDKLKPIAKSFNDLYSFEKEVYKFEIDLESENIFFTMKRGMQSIILDYQSTGFKWFFNLYFNLLCSNALKCGDIVLMDEPATNLHVKGQQELRAFLKDFAIRNDITIVLATHSPFLIDIDYLDELRVVSMDNNISHICNDFSTIDAEDPDSLKPIKEALTVNNNHLYDPDTKVVFVEGITDYNYMVAFKKMFNNDGIVFLPIQGVGKYGSTDFKDRQKDISKRLIKIKKHSPILMVDGDSAGKSMKKTNDESELTVFALTDVKAEFKTIESLFSATDLKNLGIEIEAGKYVKQSSLSALFKTFDIHNKEISEETVQNFKLLFDYILDL